MAKKKKDNNNEQTINHNSVVDDDFRTLEGISDTAKIVTLLGEDGKIERQTILSPKQRKSIAILKAYAKKYDLGILNTFTDSFMELSVSLKGKRAEQIVEIAKANAMVQQLQMQNAILKKDKNK